MSNEICGDKVVTRIVNAVLSAWPEHIRFIQMGLASRTPNLIHYTVETVQLVERLTGGEIDSFIDGYRWMCEMILAEEIEFRRTGHYRYASFEDVNLLVYQNKELMSRYQSGGRDWD